MKVKQRVTESSLYRVFVREWRRVTSRPVYWVGMVIAPLVTALFMLSLMHQGLPNSLPLAVVDQEQSATSRNLIRHLDAFQQTEVVLQTNGFAEARKAMQRGEVYGILLIPRNFTAQTVTGKQPKITYYTNNNYMMGGSLLYRDMKMLSELASGAVGLKVGLAKGESQEHVMSKVLPIKVNPHVMGNPWINYSIYINSVAIPGVLQLLILQMTVYSIAIEIKRRTARGWLRTAKGSIWKALIGKLSLHTIIYMIVGMTCLAMMHGFLHFPLNGGWASITLAMLMLIVAAQSLGVLFISLLPVLRWGLSLASLFGMLAFSISGFSFPVDAMYAPIKSLTWLFPLRHYFLIYVDQALNGFPLQYSWEALVGLSLLIILPWFNVKQLKEHLLSAQYIM